MPSPVVQLRVPVGLLAQVEEARGGESTSAWIRDAIVRKLGGPLGPPPPKGARSPVVVYDTQETHIPDPELERRRKIAATHHAGCGCLNCTLAR